VKGDAPPCCVKGQRPLRGQRAEPLAPSISRIVQSDMANLNSRSKTFCLLPISFEVIEGKIDSRTGEINEDLSRYVLQIQEEMEFVERTLKGILNPMNSFVLKAEKEQDNRL
ncbi:hypothetical protein Tco_0485024, partial [Tanacetum coccineum]